MLDGQLMEQAGGVGLLAVRFSSVLLLVAAVSVVSLVTLAELVNSAELATPASTL